MRFIIGQADAIMWVMFAITLFVLILIILFPKTIEIGSIEIGIGPDGFYIKIKEAKNKKTRNRKNKKKEKIYKYKVIASLTCWIIITLPFYFILTHLLFNISGAT